MANGETLLLKLQSIQEQIEDIKGRINALPHYRAAAQGSWFSRFLRERPVLKAVFISVCIAAAVSFVIAVVRKRR